MNTIRMLRERAGLSQAELAKLCGVHQTAVSQWENSRTAPDRESLAMLAECFNVGVSVLLSEDSRTSVPVLGSVRADLPQNAVENVMGYEEISQHLASQGEYFALKVEGESMLPRICPGDTVIVRRQNDADSGDIAVVLVGEDDATIKKVIKKDSGLLLMPLNPLFEPLYFSAPEMENRPVSIIGKVVELRGRV